VRFRGLALVALMGVAACSSASPDEPSAVAPLAAAGIEVTTTTAAPPPETTTTTAAPPPPTTTTAPPLPARSVTRQGFVPFAVVGPLTLVHPAALVERVGFHESNHDGAQQLAPLPTAVSAATLESRERDTGPRGAADIVVDPATEIRSPVTGVVKRGGVYTLYCDHKDNFVVIEPDARPGWEVKLLHMVGLRVRAGQRVVAGQTLIAENARKLPFESQVDELAAPLSAWPHVHIEVVDPTIKDRPTPGGGCN
jgi:biotin carboxyl carrier protein